MPENDEKVFVIDDFSLGAQSRTTIFSKRKNQVRDSLNASYSIAIGGVAKRLGSEKSGEDLTSTSSTSTSTSTTTTSTSTSTSSSTSSSTTTTSTSTTTTA